MTSLGYTSHDSHTKHALAASVSASSKQDNISSARFWTWKLDSCNKHFFLRPDTLFWTNNKYFVFFFAKKQTPTELHSWHPSLYMCKILLEGSCIVGIFFTKSHLNLDSRQAFWRMMYWVHSSNELYATLERQNTINEINPRLQSNHDIYRSDEVLYLFLVSEKKLSEALLCLFRILFPSLAGLRLILSRNVCTLVHSPHLTVLDIVVPDSTQLSVTKDFKNF